MEVSAATTNPAISEKTKKAENVLTDNIQNFLTLFIEQLKNQDPLEPADSSEFTSQISDIANVEQAINQNKNLEELIALQKEALSGGLVQSQINAAVLYLGKEIEFESNQINLVDQEAKFSYQVPDDKVYESVNLIIKDTSGRTIFTQNLNNRPGKHDFQWNGTDRLGDPVPDDAYSIEVLGQEEGQDIAELLTTSTKGIATGARVEEGSVILDVGKIFADLIKIQAVSEVEEEENIVESEVNLSNVITDLFSSDETNENQQN